MPPKGPPRTRTVPTAGSWLEVLQEPTDVRLLFPAGIRGIRNTAKMVFDGPLVIVAEDCQPRRDAPLVHAVSRSGHRRGPVPDLRAQNPFVGAQRFLGED